MHGRYHLYVKKDNYTEPDKKDDLAPRDWTIRLDDWLENYVDGLSLEHSRPWKDVDYVNFILKFIYAIFIYHLNNFIDLGACCNYV